MRMQTITPAASVLTLAKVKAFLRVDVNTDDTLIGDLMSAAELKCASFTRRALAATVVGLWFDLGEIYREIDGTGCVTTPLGQLVSVAKVATYADDGTETTVPSSDYYVDTVSSWEGRVLFFNVSDGSRPVNSLFIQCTVGYATCPAILVQGMMMLVAHWYENREAYDKGVVPATIRNMWNQERIMHI